MIASASQPVAPPQGTPKGPQIGPRRIVDLNALVAALPAPERERFERIFHLSVTTGELVPPETMHAWIAGHFGSVDAVRQQRIVKITNKVTLEGSLFNELRANRPIEAPPHARDLEQTLQAQTACPFCSPKQGTPADAFGRVQGRACITASNIAKYDGFHAVIVFDDHHPQHLTADRVADYVKTAQRWARAAHQVDPAACYPFFIWNCLWRSGASILHGHAQMTLTRGMHYARVENWRQASQRYRDTYGSDYFHDLVDVYRALGLAIEHGDAIIAPSLTPFKEKEILVVAPRLDDSLKAALYGVLRTFVEDLGVQSFNLGLYQPPLADTPEDWDHFPIVARIIDRGRLQSNTSDIGSMEIFAQSVITTDPFPLAEALRAKIQEVTT